MDDTLGCKNPLFRWAFFVSQTFVLIFILVFLLVFGKRTHKKIKKLATTNDVSNTNIIEQTFFAALESYGENHGIPVADKKIAQNKEFVALIFFIHNNLPKKKVFWFLYCYYFFFNWQKNSSSGNIDFTVQTLLFQNFERRAKYF
jgi:hypothetical protein